MTKPYLFRRLFDQDTGTYTYVLADSKTKEAVIIDPVKAQFERDLKLIRELGLELKLILDTHVHADHVTGATKLKKETGAKIGIAADPQIKGNDIEIHDGDCFNIGCLNIKCLYTPGHTDQSFCFVIDNLVFTGDTLLIRGCGRTDFQSGSAEKLYDSVRNQLFHLPDDYQVYPAHDYKGVCCSTIGEEKRFNPRLNEKVAKEEFVQIMANLKLPPPKYIEVAVPANMNCGAD